MSQLGGTVPDSRGHQERVLQAYYDEWRIATDQLEYISPKTVLLLMYDHISFPFFILTLVGVQRETTMDVLVNDTKSLCLKAGIALFFP